MEYLKLNNGVKIPNIGIGVFTLSPNEAEESVYNALQCGYRLIDTANAYENEKAVGRGMKKSKIAREEIFLSTKLWPSVYEDESAIDKTLERLDVDYIDLLFLHQPTENYMFGYRQLEKAYKNRQIKAIGVSNFEGKYIQEILANCEIKPQVIQVEAHPYFTQSQLRKIIDIEDIKLMSWYPLGHGDKNLLNESVFKELAEKYNKTPAQIILRWHTQMRFIVIPGSKNPTHIRDNFDIFDFELTVDEMVQISKLDNDKRYYHRTDEALAGFANWMPNLDNQE